MKTRLLPATLTIGVFGSVASAHAQDARCFRLVGPVPTTITAVTPDETNWVGWVQVLVSKAVTLHRVFDPNPPQGMALIPAGLFTMGGRRPTPRAGREAGLLDGTSRGTQRLLPAPVAVRGRGQRTETGAPLRAASARPDRLRT